MRALTILASPDRDLQHKIQLAIEKECEVVFVSGFEELMLTLHAMPLAAKLVFADIRIFQNISKDLQEGKDISPLPEWIILSTESQDLDVCREILSHGVCDVLIPPFDHDTFTIAARQALLRTDTAQKLNETLFDPFVRDREARYGVTISLAGNRRLNNQPPFDDEELLALIPLHERQTPAAIDLMQEMYGDDWESHLQPKRRLKVLVIDDEEGIRLSLEDILRIKKYDPLMAKDAKEAIEIALDTPDLDIALVDIGLPDLNGVELLPKLKQINPTFEAIMLTAYQDVPRMVSSFKGAAFSYLTKPFDQDTLLQELSKAVQRRYLRRTYDHFGKPAWTQLSEGTKLRLLRSIAEKRMDQNLPFMARDVYAFFPELKASGTPEDALIPRQKVQDGLLYVIEDLRGLVAR